MKNWKTTFAGIGSALFGALTVLAALPYQLGPVAEIVPPEWKPWIVKVGLVSTLALRIIAAITAADAKPTSLAAHSRTITLALVAGLWLGGVVLLTTSCSNVLVSVRPPATIHLEGDIDATPLLRTISAWRGESGLPDLRLAHEDGPRAFGLSK